MIQQEGLDIDEDMIAELKMISNKTSPIEKLLVADSMLGQDAISIAQNFNEKIGLTGIILTKLDGNSSGGAALSMRYITNTPIKFLCNGEKSRGYRRISSR